MDWRLLARGVNRLDELLKFEQDLKDAYVGRNIIHFLMLVALKGCARLFPASIMRLLILLDNFKIRKRDYVESSTFHTVVERNSNVHF